ncbi:YHS domain-containing (seleno)protein [Shewanella sp. NIFS-20-20]|uniref:YHS domain-containing (seleno)protein n=1 Tax=Shewanella sp. NIFS-20-20 TaxID=2853806 RepID=UPI001C49065B|nr:YHS domain-containing (seleno)protein [Shewanella sp. NIFS-20-20]MBV7315178.1 tat pathway signal sequence domain protein [Shewanella sp. NIFS-20-20]
MMMRIGVVLSLVVTLMGCTSLGRDTWYVDDQGLGASGYDLVSYQTEHKAVAGTDEFVVIYGGVQWQFSSAEHAELFRQQPLQYLPQYGGYCAYAMAQGFVVSSDPQAFTWYNNKLYLNYSLSVRDTWLKDKDGYIDAANENWQQKLAAQQR